MKDVINPLPFNIQDHENISVTTHKMTGTIRNKVFTINKQ